MPKIVHIDRHNIPHSCLRARRPGCKLKPITVFSTRAPPAWWNTSCDRRTRPVCYRSIALFYSSMFRGSMSNRIPSSTCFTRSRERLPIFSTKSALSTVNIYVTLTTLCLDKFASPFSNSTLPGALARLRFDVSAHTTAVLRRLRLNRLFWTTTWG